MTELARYQEGPASVVVSRDGDDLVFRSSYDDCGKTILEESRIAVANFVAKGEGPWPWYDLGDKHDGTLMVLDALGVEPPPWTTPLADNVLDLFDQARGGSSEVIELLAWGAEPDPVDPCGASPLWYAVRSLSAGIVVALIDAGADAGRRIDLSARGERFTTILHEIVRLGRTVALAHALTTGVAPDLRDSDGATPLHVVDGNGDNVNPEMVRALVRAGAAVDAAMPSGALTHRTCGVPDSACDRGRDGRTRRRPPPRPRRAAVLVASRSAVGGISGRRGRRHRRHPARRWGRGNRTAPRIRGGRRSVAGRSALRR